MNLEDKILSDLEPVLSKMGISIVELSAHKVKSTIQIVLIIHHADGVSLDLCSDAASIVNPRLEMLLDDEDYKLEISSPGIARKIKDPREYSIFQGRGLSYLTTDSNEWAGGIIEACDGSVLQIKEKDEVISIDVADILKSKLDYTQEGK